ncbi:hypothetical protein H8356DRAFT_1352516 [Neocallimastix lanati (nom. inval.)]|nr:hypothetical protein H8356DRAFT_1352516 [Neocallimastix sp. JGI-2020a]
MLRENSNLQLEHWFSKYYLFHIEILYEKFFIISKYCPISNNSDSSNEEYNINNNNNRNNIVNNNSISNSENRNINIRDSKNNSVVTNNAVNKSIDEKRFNISNFLNYDQIISGDYSKTPFLVRFVALFIEIMPWASTRQGLLFRRANASEGEDYNFFQIFNSNPNPEHEFPLNRNLIILEVITE